MKRLLAAGLFFLVSLLDSRAQWTGIMFVDISTTNTVATAGTPSPFWTENAADAGFTSGNLWRRRTGFGFDQGSQNGIFEKDANGGLGDAALLKTTLSDLQAGQSYAVYVCYLSATGEDWRVKAGFAANELTLFTSSEPSGRVENLGLSSEASSNRNQMRAFVGNATADVNGQIVVYLDDDTANTADKRCWIDALAVGPPVIVPEPWTPDAALTLASDGVWTWFNNPRALFHQGKLYFGYVKNATTRPALSVYTPGTGNATELFTFAMPEDDDHNNPGFTATASGKLLALASKHGTDRKIVCRTSLNTNPGTLSDWGAERVYTLPSAGTANTTYNNPYLLSSEGGLIFNFIRYINWNPTIVTSSDEGATWSAPVQLIQTGTGATRPYTQFSGNGTDRIDMIYTDGHPENGFNSVYHLYYKSDPSGTPAGGSFRKSNGDLIKTIANLPLQHDSGERGTVVYAYSTQSSSDPNAWIAGGRAWVWDLATNSSNQPVCAFQVQKTNVTGTGWQHHRIYYYYARWTGTTWQKRFIAQAGRPLYSDQPDYGGGMTIDPTNPNMVYISSNAQNPFSLASLTNVPLKSADRYEIYRGVTKDGGVTFEWTALTQNSSEDNIRPSVPKGNNFARGVLWLRGTYAGYTNFSTRVMGLFSNEPVSYEDWQIDQASGALAGQPLMDVNRDGVTNLQAYAWGFDALEEVSSLSRPRSDIVENGGSDHLSITYRQRRNGKGLVGVDYRAGGVEYRVEVSPDLSENSWVSGSEILEVAGVPVNNGDGTETVVVRMKSSLAAAGSRYFIRLRITSI